MDSIIQTGLQSFHRGMESAAGHADELSRAFEPEGSGDVVSPIVGLVQDQVQVRAATRIIQVGADLQNTILDILA